MQPDRLQGARSERGRVTFITEHDPLHVEAGRLGDPSRTLGMKSPLEVIPLDDDRCRDFSVATPLELGSNVDEKRAVLGRRIGVSGLQS